MSAVSKSKRSGRRWTVASVAVLGASLPALLVGQRVLDPDGWGRPVTYAALAGLLAATGLRALALASARDDARRVEARLLWAYAFVLGSVGLYFLSLPAGLSLLGLSNDAPGNAGGVLSVLWLSVMLVSLCAILFIELVYLRMPIAESVEWRRVRRSLHAGLSLGLAIVFVMAMNYVATARDVRKDVTYFKTTEPSEATRTMIQRLDRPLRVVLLYPPASDVLSQVEPYFAALSRDSDKFSYEITDVALVPELAQAHKVTDNGQVLLLQSRVDRDEGGEEPADPPLVHGHAARPAAKEPAERGELLRIGNTLTESRSTLRKLDAEFQERFRRLVQPERAVFLTVGHGERNEQGGDRAAGDQTAAMRDILQRLNVKQESLGIAEGLGNAVPDGASAVVIVGPSEPFLPEEVNALLSYVRDGGRLLLMVDPGRDLGLSALYAGLGIDLLPGTVASRSKHMRRSFNASDRTLIYTDRYTSHPAVTTVSRHARQIASIFDGAVAIEAVKGKSGAEGSAPRATFPIQTDRSYFRDLNSNYELDGDEQEQALNLMAAITFPKQGDREGRAVVIGDGDFITDKLSRSGGNVLPFVDCLAWLIGNEELSAVAESEEDVRIEHSREQDKVWFYGTTFAVPAPVVGLGLWIARRRRRRGEVRS